MKQLKRYNYDYPHPAVTTDVVLFTIQMNALSVLLIQRKNPPFQSMWALPGGFLDIDEDLESCAKRELKEETGIEGVYLEQLGTFGTPLRDPRERVISVAYFALTPSDHLSPAASSDAAKTAWYPISNLPELAFDHADIIEKARKRLIAKLGYTTIAFQMLPDSFTLSQLQSVYEVLLNENLDKRNFRKGILARNIINETGEYSRQGNHRPAKNYQVINPSQVEIIK
ncbi:MAG: NUDIX domain-containing protein [Candidatus Thiodiazotropha sp. LLP2]